MLDHTRDKLDLDLPHMQQIINKSFEPQHFLLMCSFGFHPLRLTEQTQNIFRRLLGFFRINRGRRLEGRRPQPPPMLMIY